MSWIKSIFKGAKALYDPRVIASGVKDLYHTPNESSQTVDARRQQQVADYSARAGGLNELGYPNNPLAGPPPAEIANLLQLQSDKTVADRNARLTFDAGNEIEQGKRNYSDYRPGGQVALTSGLYQAKADVLMRSQTESPDLLGDVRRQQNQAAKKAARGAANSGIAQGVIAAAGAVLAVPTGGASLAAAAAASAALASQNRQQAMQGSGVKEASLGGQSLKSIRSETGLSDSSGAFTGQQQPQAQGGVAPQGDRGPEGLFNAGGGGGAPVGPSAQSQPQGGGGGESANARVGGGGGAQGGPQVQGGAGGAPPPGSAIDPGASAYGPATAMGTPYPSREGLSAGAMAHVGPNLQAILSRTYLNMFGQDPWWDRRLQSLDALAARIDNP